MDLTLTLSTAFLATAGFTADVGPALQIAGGLRRDWFSFDLEARVVFPSKVYARERKAMWVDGGISPLQSF
jgi:hypothetical protein